MRFLYKQTIIKSLSFRDLSFSLSGVFNTVPAGIVHLGFDCIIVLLFGIMVDDRYILQLIQDI